MDPFLMDERSPTPFRTVFRKILGESTELDTAILRIRLSGVDLSPRELEGLHRLRILVADLNAQTLEEEAFALFMDPGKRDTLERIQRLLGRGLLELRASPLAGWSPDFSVFSDRGGPRALLLGLHWIQRPFPHRGPAWLAAFGSHEARHGRERFEELWRGGHDIGPAVLKLLTRTASRWTVHSRRRVCNPSARLVVTPQDCDIGSHETRGFDPPSPRRPTERSEEGLPFVPKGMERSEGALKNR